MKHIAIIGAGISGLSLAHMLRPVANVTLFEKARGVSGRCSTRYHDNHQFDHGTQYFTARSKDFIAFIKPYLDSGIIAPWEPTIVTLEEGKKPYKRDWFEPHYVGVPKMNAFPKALAEPLEITLNTRIALLSKRDSWYIAAEDGTEYGPYDWVVSTAPPVQTLALLPPAMQDIQHIKDSKMQPTFTLMLGFDAEVPVPWHAALCKDEVIRWISANATKPERSHHTKPGLVIHCQQDWSAQHVDDEKDALAKQILARLEALLGTRIVPTYQSLHRWLYADVATPAGVPHVIDTELQLAACGDWCIEGRVEAACLSASSLAEKIRSVI